MDAAASIERLVPYGERRPVGDVDFSSWLALRSAPDAFIERATKAGVVTEEDVLRAGGRRLHLALFEHPGSPFHSAQAVDSRAGEFVDDRREIRRFARDDLLGQDLKHDAHLGLRDTRSILDSPLPIGNDLCVVDFTIGPDGPETTISPSAVPVGEADHYHRGNSLVSIVPDAERLHMIVNGNSPALGGTFVEMRIQEDRETPPTLGIELSTYTAHYENTGTVNIAIDHTGEPTHITGNKNGVYERLGIEFKDGWQPGANHAFLPDSATLVLRRVHEMLGYGQAPPVAALDLRLTAHALYTMLGQRHIDPLRALIFQD